MAGVKTPLGKPDTSKLTADQLAVYQATLDAYLHRRQFTSVWHLLQLTKE
jgi:hypothetical protein